MEFSELLSVARVRFPLADSREMRGFMRPLPLRRYRSSQQNRTLGSQYTINKCYERRYK